MVDCAWVTVAIIGVFVCIDGVGSILIQHGQYHGRWFDFEREVRAIAGFILIVLGLWRILQNT